MIETGLVYIYSISPARAFKGCGALLEGGYVATCRHVWRIAAPAGQPPSNEPAEVEIEFPRIKDDQGIAFTSRASLADGCEGLEVPAPDLVLLKPLNIPAGAATVRVARHRLSEVGAGIALAGLIGLDKNKPSRLRDVPVNGEIADFKDASGLRQFTGNKPQGFWLKPGASGSPVFLERGQELAGMVVLSETGVNEGESHLLEAFVSPATTIIRFLGRHLAKPVADELGIDPHLLQPSIDGLCAQDDVRTSEFAARLRENIVAVRAQAAKPVPVSNDGADIDAAIVASREKLGALDTAGALDVLQAKLDEEEQERTRRRIPLLKERAAVERLAFDYDAAKKTLVEVTRLAPDDVWAFIGLGDIYVTTGPLEEAAKAFRNAEAAARRQGNERDQSVSLNRIGDVQVAQGDLAGALKSYQDGLAIAERLAKSDSANAGRQFDLALSNVRIGDVQRAQGSLAGALKSYRDQFTIMDRLAKSNPGNAGWQRNLSVSNERLGDIFRAQGNLPAALEQYRASLERMVPIHDRDPRNADLQRFTFVTFYKIGDLQQAQGDLGGALKSYQEGLAVFETLAKSDPGNAGWQRDLSVSFNRIGDVQRAQGDLAGALKSYQDDLAITEKLAKSDPGNAGWQRDLSVSNERLGDIFLAQGNLPAALEQYRASLERIVPIRDRDPSNADLQRFTSVTFNKIGDVQKAQGDLAGALKSYNDTLSIAEKLAKSDPSNAGWQRDLALSFSNLASVYRQSGDSTKALEALRQGQAILARLTKLSPDNAVWAKDLARFDGRIAELPER